ncbi:ABC-F family ATP-binding cassette domain-containing protein [Pseudomonas sp. UBA6562]|uniref:ABC-F family ATP-binding cassette domain-containing protein n=1 Tax=Pseudomonas sp. UBA6562 TaxID=1947332 RepID=UPI0025CBC741|nr:ATP-binding cassette domain-containing protein [Pseudomonas sp. UBA6562]
MTNPSILTLDRVTYALPNGRLLFDELDATFDRRPTGLVGANGVGKSLLGRLLAGDLAPTAGRCLRHGQVHRLDQHILRRSRSVADLAQLAPVLDALRRIAQGSVDPADFDTVGERWTLAEQLRALLDRQGLGGLDLYGSARDLSPGQAMRVAIGGAFLAQADYLILDEPSNHLDREGRAHLQALIEQWPRGLLLISHDRALLEPLQRTLELSALGLRSYGGGYGAYRQAKSGEQASAQHDLDRLKRQRQRDALDAQKQRERQAQQQARGRGDARQANQAQILLDRQQQRSQATAGKRQRSQLKARQALHAQIGEAARLVERTTAISVQPPTAQRPLGRILLSLEHVQLPYGHAKPLNLRLLAGERLAVTGANGSGKSTLLKLIHGDLSPRAGCVRLHGTVALLDQQASALPPGRSAFEHLRQANAQLDSGTLRTCLAQAGLDAARVDLPSRLLSGGERMKAALVALLHRQQPIDLLLLDEPGNHLDLAALEALERMLAQFCGSVLVVSHDEVLLERLELMGRFAL